MDGAGSGLDHLLGEEVGGLFVTEARIDVGNDRHHVGFKAVDLLDDGRFVAAGFTGVVKLGEEALKLNRIGLLEEGVNFADQ